MKIVQSSIDEHGNAIGGQAGDQTGFEVYIRDWWDKGWNRMIRCKSSLDGTKAVQIAKKLANSNLIGYDQGDRNTLYRALKKYNFDVDRYIASGEKTECDCSSFLYAVYCCLYRSLRSDANAPTTRTWPDFAKKHSDIFTVFTASKFLRSDTNLRAGDLVDKTGSHIIMACGNANTTASCNAKYYRACRTGYKSIVDALASVGERDTSLDHRRRIALANGIIKSLSPLDRILTDKRNKQMRQLLEAGKLIKVD